MNVEVLPLDPFRSLVEEIPAVTYIADFVDEFKLRYVSPQIRAILGYEPDDWIADPDGWVMALHPDDRDRIVQEATRCIAAEQPFDFEYRMHTGDGRLLHIWEKTSIIYGADGRPVAINGVMLDVTELKVAQETLLRHERERADERTRFQARLQAQVEENRHQALHDHLTGLPNRRHFHHRLAETIRAGIPTSVLLVDLDRFKEVNDALGHHCGDELLTQVARRCERLLRPHDILARLGGDEFAICLPEEDDGRAAIVVAQRICDVLTEPFVLHDVPVYVESSIGIALYPQDGDDVETVLRHADKAMYDAKGAKEAWRLYDGTAAAPMADVSRLAELRVALQEEQLTLYYQPKLDLSTGAVTSVEALVRWRHPVLGLLSPAEFIPLAEPTGLIWPLTMYVLSDALRQCRLWRDEGRSIAVAVNVAPRSLADPRFAPAVASVLQEVGLPPEALELEITETGLMFDPARSMQTVRDLHAMGVTLALDDFGTGYSSLRRLRDLPIDHLKIDRSFVLAMSGDERDSQIVRSTIALGKTLGMHVVAEGVEDAAVLESLLMAGCDAAQGFHIARPAPPEQLAEVFDEISRLMFSEPQAAGERARGRRRSPGAAVAPLSELVDG